MPEIHFLNRPFYQLDLSSLHCNQKQQGYSEHHATKAIKIIDIANERNDIAGQLEGVDISTASPEKVEASQARIASLDSQMQALNLEFDGELSAYTPSRTTGTTCGYRIK